jgi:hypothetical protein
MYPEDETTPLFVLAQEGTNDRVVVNEWGLFLRSMPDGADSLPLVEVPDAIYEKLTENPAFVSTTRETVASMAVFGGVYGLGYTFLSLGGGYFSIPPYICRIAKALVLVSGLLALFCQDDDF